MIILDTNVISEFTRPVTSERVSSWFRKQSANQIYTTTVTEAELLLAFSIMPDGKKKTELTRATEVMLKLFGDRVLAFDRAAAREFPRIVVKRRAAGEPVHEADVMIAAIALAHGASVATRNGKDFTKCGLDIINPWTA